MTTTSDALRTVAGDDELMYTVGRGAVEDVLIDFRDSGISILGRNNGLVVKHLDGSSSDIIRLSIEGAVTIALEAMADHLDKEGAAP